MSISSKRLSDRPLAPMILALFAFATPVRAQSDLQQGFSGALRGCEEWVLNPESWRGGPAPFIAAVGLGDRMGLVDEVDPSTLPPPELRVNNHVWRINSTVGAGYILIVSDKIPMCHITGGGDADLQPVVEAVLASDAFTSRWERVSEETVGDMASTTFRNRKAPAFSIVISRARLADQRLDRVQVLATARWKLQ